MDNEDLNQRGEFNQLLNDMNISNTDGRRQKGRSSVFRARPKSSLLFE
jgi:hypothetical protein